ncbi:hypothetical protein [Helicobacter didelphidarum]|nr:hypothetical protein [Helicobacter didelphidarum]
MGFKSLHELKEFETEVRKIRTKLKLSKNGRTFIYRILNIHY